MEEPSVAVPCRSSRWPWWLSSGSGTRRWRCSPCRTSGVTPFPRPCGQGRSDRPLLESPPRAQSSLLSPLRSSSTGLPKRSTLEQRRLCGSGGCGGSGADVTSTCVCVSIHIHGSVQPNSGSHVPVVQGPQNYSRTVPSRRESTSGSAVHLRVREIQFLYSSGDSKTQDK